MTGIVFRLNGESVVVRDPDPTLTVLDWLREERGLTGTKEGCNEGDCGACTVMVTDRRGSRALNSCILFMPQLDGKALRTVEGLTGPNGEPHPVQRAMEDNHGSQCGFCTPGFVVSMATAHLNGASDHDNQLSGNLCRCTGYAPIVRAARSVEGEPVPEWIVDEPPEESGRNAFLPRSSDELAAWCLANPDAVPIAGATDVGLWVNKDLRDPGPVVFLHAVEDLEQIEILEDRIRIGACVTLTDLMPVMAEHHPSFSELIRRFGSVQVRNAATLGGNIANGSPIGDAPPALIALGARLHLRRGDVRRDIPLEDFFVEYGRQDRAPGEFVEFVTIPRQPDNLRCYKLSKRFDQDISAVCGCFNIAVEAGTVTSARIAFGGMAGIPERAVHAENALMGRPWTGETMEEARREIGRGFTPISDMRASAVYRLAVAKNMLTRCFAESQGIATSVLEVRP